MKDLIKKAMKKRGSKVTSSEDVLEPAKKEALYEDMTKDIKPMGESEYKAMHQMMMQKGKPAVEVKTIKVEKEEADPSAMQDIAPGKPADPVDEKSVKDNADDSELEMSLIEEMMGGEDEDSLKELKGRKLSLLDRIKLNALKMKKQRG